MSTPASLPSLPEIIEGLKAATAELPDNDSLVHAWRIILAIRDNPNVRGALHAAGVLFTVPNSPK